MTRIVSVLALLLAPGFAFAGNADVVRVEAIQDGGDRWTFVVTMRHADKDPDHWADWWVVRASDGRELGRRVLLHSHVDEQPFTRDEQIRIPGGVHAVVVAAHDKVHGYGGTTVTVDLTKASGPGYTVKRGR